MHTSGGWAEMAGNHPCTNIGGQTFNSSGKSIDAVVINHDLIKSFFLDNDIPFTQSSKLTYRFDWVLAEDMIKQGQNVIVDSTCNYKETLDQGQALARRHGYKYRYVECRVDDIDFLDWRLRDRVSLRCQRSSVDGPPPDDASGVRYGENYRALFRRWIERPCRPADGAVVVGSSGGLEDCVECILTRIVPQTGA